MNLDWQYFLRDLAASHWIGFPLQKLVFDGTDFSSADNEKFEFLARIFTEFGQALGCLDQAPRV